MMKKTLGLLVTVSLVLAACNSNNSIPIDVPVTGEIHDIQPSDVDAFVANFEAQRARIDFTFDGTNYPLTFLDVDFDNNVLIAQFNGNDILLIGFDIEEMEPLSRMGVIELAEDDETVTRQWLGTMLSLQ